MIIRPADMEYILAVALEDLAPTSANPIPADLQAPYLVFTRTGGTRQSVAIDTHNVSIDVYGLNYGEAIELAGTAVGRVCDLYGQVVAGTQIGAVDVLTLPYINPDPNHPSLARVTFSAQIIAKATIEN